MGNSTHLKMPILRIPYSKSGMTIPYYCDFWAWLLSQAQAEKRSRASWHPGGVQHAGRVNAGNRRKGQAKIRGWQQQHFSSPSSVRFGAGEESLWRNTVADGSTISGQPVGFCRRFLQAYQWVFVASKITFYRKDDKPKPILFPSDSRQSPAI